MINRSQREAKSLQWLNALHSYDLVHQIISNQDSIINWHTSKTNSHKLQTILAINVTAIIL